MRLAFILAFVASAFAAERSFDVVVYGGTAGGVVSAVTAAREGLNTALISPDKHLGGMVSGGLSNTDVGKKEVIGGTALEFYLRAGRKYGLSDFGQEIAWRHEPHVAEEIFRQMIASSGAYVFEARLKERGGVRTAGARIESIETENGDVFRARVFIDASYEGDLMAQAGVSYMVGREGSAEFGESLAGVRDKTPLHQFLVDILPRDETGRLLPEISTRQLPPPGTADRAVQAYNYRFCFSQVAANQAPFRKPSGYEPARYTLFAKLVAARTKAEGRVPALGSVLSINPIPNGKADINNNGGVSTDYVGGSWEYPDASYAKRAEIAAAHRAYDEGFLYFLANDAGVPEALRAEMNRWGMCKEEFTDNGNWPYQLYIREARRMKGEFTMTQKDLQADLLKPDAIGMGSYNSDSHNVERIVGPGGFVRNEGDMQVAVKPYQIPYRILLPKKAEATNLLVSAAFSASHVAYSSVRMEPQYMILGQAAAVAAKMAIASGAAVQDIDAAALRLTLVKQGAVMEYEPGAQAAAAAIARQRAGR